MWFWIGLTLGVAAGTTLGVLAMALCAAAGRVPVEDAVDHVADEAQAWLRGRGTR